MPGLDLLAVQDTITAHIESVMAQDVYEDAILDNDNLIRDPNGILKPYIVLRYGPLRRKLASKSVAGVRYDDYYSTCDVSTVAPTGRIARQVMNVLIGTHLLGYKPEPGGQEMVVEGGGSAEFVVTNSENKPSAYVSTVRMIFGVNQTDISAPPA